MEERVHAQGGDKHLNELEKEVATRQATRDAAGLMPPAMIYDGVWYEPPASTDAPGRTGMRAFDENYFYFCVSDGKWGRVLLSDWVI
jgi:hypothetical protein